MELVVFVDGHQRSITGELEDSTVYDVIMALADATNTNGKFIMALRNKSNNTDYYLRSTDIPFKVLKSFQERGIDACLEVCDASQVENMFSSEFDNMLAGMNRKELEEFIHNQEKILWNHQLTILGIESELTNEVEREYFQLLRQSANLRNTLSEMQSVDWKKELISELSELNRLNSAIEVLRVEIDNKNRKLKEISRLIYSH